LASGHRISTTFNGQNHFKKIGGSKVLDEYYNSYLSKQSFDQLKAYTDAVVERVSSKNAHSDHNRRHNYPGNQGAQDLYASM
jgi:hypothetical protein